MAADRITLCVPAKSEYAKTVRMAAAALVSRMGMTYDDVDDVRMAAEEAFVYAVDSLPEGEDVSIVFHVDDAELRIDVSVGDSADAFDDEDERRASLATFILESVCDSYEFCSDENGAHLRLTKRVGVRDVDAE